MYKKADRQLKLEVKNDEMALKTGNLAIEFYNSNSGKPSGINSTVADIWCHVLGQEIWIIKCDLLRNIITDDKIPKFKTLCNVGDGNANIHLYKRDNLLINDLGFYRIDDKAGRTMKILLEKVYLC